MDLPNEILCQTFLRPHALRAGRAVALERAIASGMASANMHLPNGSGWVLSALTLAPLALIAAGVLVYLGGAILGLK